jgi:hypothetical protein
MIGKDGRRKGFSTISAFNEQVSPEEVLAAFWDSSTGRGSSLVIVTIILMYAFQLVVRLCFNPKNNFATAHQTQIWNSQCARYNIETKSFTIGIIFNQ